MNPLEHPARAAILDILRERDLSPLTICGYLESGPPGEVILLDAENRPFAPPRSSWDHFRTGGSKA